MADIIVEFSSSNKFYAEGIHCGPIYTSTSVGYVFYANIDRDLVYRKTTDGGASWGSPVSVDATITIKAIDVWFDKHTPGGTGTLIHIAWLDLDSSDVLYRTLDTSDDTLGTQRTIFTGTAMTDGDWADLYLSINKAVGGNLYVQFWINSTGETGFYRSTDAGVNWISRTNGADGNAVDQVIVLPDGDAADNQDMAMVYWDSSANELSIKKYDDSGNSWSETLIATGFAESSEFFRQFDAMVRHSDDHIIVVAHEAVDSATNDYKCYDITLTTPTVTAKTDIITAKDDVAVGALFIDLTTDALYAFYCGQDDGAQTIFSAVDIHYKKSSDGGDTWGSEVTYSVNTADDLRAIWTGRATPGDAAGRVGPMFFNDDINDLFVNVTNSVEITAGPTAALTGTALPSATEAEIAAGGETVIITLTDDTWLDAGGAFDGSRQAIIDGFDAAASPALGWNDEVRDKAPTSVAVRTSPTVVTMTWTSAASAYDISSAETITVTIPAAALTTSGSPITADETFEITVVVTGLSIPIAMYYYRQRRR